MFDRMMTGTRIRNGLFRRYLAQKIPIKQLPLTEISYHFRLFSKSYPFLQMSHVSYRCPSFSRWFFFKLTEWLKFEGTSGNRLLFPPAPRRVCWRRLLRAVSSCIWSTPENRSYKNLSGQPVAVFDNSDSENVFSCVLSWFSCFSFVLTASFPFTRYPCEEPDSVILTHSTSDTYMH